MKRKIHYFSVLVDDEIPTDGDSTFGQTLQEIMSLSPQERTLDYGVQGQDKVRLGKLYQSGDHYLGIIAKYEADSAVTGNLNDDDLFDLTLEDGTSIVERTHFAYFPATDILAVEYNQSGAREGTLKWYINKIMSQRESDLPA